MAIERYLGQGKRSFRYEPETTAFASEILCDRCKHKRECGMNKDDENCKAYNFLNAYLEDKE